MQEYLKIANNVLEHGTYQVNRTVMPAKVLPFQTFQHNMKSGFPLLTTKLMSLKNIAIELEGFIQGITDKRWYQARGCHIWDEWANPHTNHNDLGPIYPHQWRMFGKHYEFCNTTEVLDLPYIPDNGIPNGVDQLHNIVTTLKNNPNDRRMVCSAWNPMQSPYMALPPCHFAWNIVHIDGILHLGWIQRSADIFLGVPYNIASYALLLLLLCAEGNFKPGILHGTLANCHLYENHIRPLQIQMARNRYPLPTVTITNNNGIFNWTHQDIQLNCYKHHPRIYAKVAI